MQERRNSIANALEWRLSCINPSNMFFLFQLLIRQSYYAATSYMDAQVGQLLAALDDQGLTQETLVMLVGDHGKG